MFENIKSLRDDFSEKSFVKITTGLSYIFLCIFMFGCALTGAGNYIKIGPLSLRMIVLLITALLGMPAFFLKIKSNLKSPMLWWLAAFVIYLVFSAAKGFSSGVDMSLLSDDIKGFSYLLLLPFAISVIDSKPKIILLMKCIIISSLILSIASIVINCMIIVNYDFADRINYLVRINGLGFFDLITRTITRLFFKSLPYIILASAFSFYFLVKGKRFNFLYVLSIALGAWAVIFSYTRSILFAAGVIAILLIAIFLIINIHSYKSILINIGMVAIAFAVLTAAICIPAKTNYIKYAIDRVSVTLSSSEAENDTEIALQNHIAGGSSNVMLASFDTALYQQSNAQTIVTAASEGQDYLDQTKNSGDAFRSETVRQQLEAIGKNPVFGMGLGSRIELREHVENTHLDMLMKMGIAGFLLYYFPFLYMLYILIRELCLRKKCDEISNERLNILSMSFLAVLTFVIVTYFNPYMNAALGIATYVVSMAVFSNRKSIFKPESTDK